MNKPNLFIVGAPKCGTTALSVYLQEHPNIFFSKPKEPHYFAEDFPKYRARDTLDSYLSIFDSALDQHYAIGEASVFYLYSSVAIKNIYNFNKNAKIIVMLRNPVDLVYSFHSQLYFTFDEDIKDFKKAWYLQPLRRQGENIPKNCREPALLQYAQVGKIGLQLQNLLNVFPMRQVKLILFEDLIQSTQLVYEDVLDFLKIESDGRTKFPRINENKYYRLHFLVRLILKTKKPEWIYIPYLKFKKKLDIENIDIFGGRIKNFLKKTRRRRPLNSSFQYELINAFKDDINLLSEIINRDLTHWTRL